LTLSLSLSLSLGLNQALRQQEDEHMGMVVGEIAKLQVNWCSP